MKRSAEGTGLGSRKLPKSALAAAMLEGHAVPAQPLMPDLQANAMFGNVGHRIELKSLTAHLDRFLSLQPQQPSAKTILQYLISLSHDVNNSQLLQSEVAYLHFAGEGNPIKYDPAADRWWTFSNYWKTSTNSLTRVGVIFKTDLLPCLRDVLQLAIRQGCFPVRDGEEHMRLQFIRDCIAALENERALKEWPRKRACCSIQVLPST